MARNVADARKSVLASIQPSQSEKKDIDDDDELAALRAAALMSKNPKTNGTPPPPDNEPVFMNVPVPQAFPGQRQQIPHPNFTPSFPRNVRPHGQMRGHGNRFGPPRNQFQPPRFGSANLIVIQTGSPQRNSRQGNGAPGQTFRNERPKSTNPLLVRPQDKWSGIASAGKAPDSPSKPKVPAKFSRYDSDSDSDSDEDTDSDVGQEDSSDEESLIVYHHSDDEEQTSENFTEDSQNLQTESNKADANSNNIDTDNESSKSLDSLNQTAGEKNGSSSKSRTSSISEDKLSHKSSRSSSSSSSYSSSSRSRSSSRSPSPEQTANPAKSVSPETRRELSPVVAQSPAHDSPPRLSPSTVNKQPISPQLSTARAGSPHALRPSPIDVISHSPSTVWKKPPSRAEHPDQSSQSHSPGRRPLSPKRPSRSPRMRSPVKPWSPPRRSRSLSPKRRSRSPRMRSPVKSWSPPRRSRSPGIYRSPSPRTHASRRRSVSPRYQGPSRSYSPRLYSPKRSPRKSRSPRQAISQRSRSPWRSRSPPTSRSPRWSRSPRRSRSPRGRAVSPFRYRQGSRSPHARSNSANRYYMRSPRRNRSPDYRSKYKDYSPSHPRGRSPLQRYSRSPVRSRSRSPYYRRGLTPPRQYDRGDEARQHNQDYSQYRSALDVPERGREAVLGSRYNTSEPTSKSWTSRDAYEQEHGVKRYQPDTDKHYDRSGRDYIQQPGADYEDRRDHSRDARDPQDCIRDRTDGYLRRNLDQKQHPSPRDARYDDTYPRQDVRENRREEYSRDSRDARYHELATEQGRISVEGEVTDAHRARGARQLDPRDVIDQRDSRSTRKPLGPDDIDQRRHRITSRPVSRENFDLRNPKYARQPEFNETDNRDIRSHIDDRERGSKDSSSLRSVDRQRDAHPRERDAYIDGRGADGRHIDNRGRDKPQTADSRDLRQRSRSPRNRTRPCGRNKSEDKIKSSRQSQSGSRSSNEQNQSAFSGAAKKAVVGATKQTISSHSTDKRQKFGRREEETQHPSAEEKAKLEARQKKFSSQMPEQKQKISLKKIVQPQRTQETEEKQSKEADIKSSPESEESAFSNNSSSSSSSSDMDAVSHLDDFDSESDTDSRHQKGKSERRRDDIEIERRKLQIIAREKEREERKERYEKRKAEENRSAKRFEADRRSRAAEDRRRERSPEKVQRSSTGSSRTPRSPSPVIKSLMSIVHPGKASRPKELDESTKLSAKSRLYVPKKTNKPDLKPRADLKASTTDGQSKSSEDARNVIQRLKLHPEDEAVSRSPPRKVNTKKDDEAKGHKSPTIKITFNQEFEKRKKQKDPAVYGSIHSRLGSHVTDTKGSGHRSKKRKHSDEKKSEEAPRPRRVVEEEPSLKPIAIPENKSKIDLRSIIGIKKKEEVTTNIRSEGVSQKDAVKTEAPERKKIRLNRSGRTGDNAVSLAGDKSREKEASLNQHIIHIQAKNAEILRRQQLVQKEKEKFG